VGNEQSREKSFRFCSLYDFHCRDGIHLYADIHTRYVWFEVWRRHMDKIRRIISFNNRNLLYRSCKSEVKSAIHLDCLDEILCRRFHGNVANCRQSRFTDSYLRCNRCHRSDMDFIIFEEIDLLMHGKKAKITTLQ
jgi:hypothetical protein